MPRRSSHPGVRLFTRRRKDGVTHYGRFRDPLTKKTRDVNLTALGFETLERRRAWAKQESERLVDLKARLKGYTDPRLVTVNQAVDRYLEAASPSLRPDSVRSYHEALKGFVAWCEGQATLDYVQQLDKAALFRWRMDLGADAGKAPRTKNSHMARVKAPLNWMRRAGMLPQLSPQEISDALRGFKAPRPDPQPLQRQALLELVTKTDDQELEVVLFYLLTGLRMSEGLRMPWSSVRRLELLVGGWSKTGAGRVIELEVCPFLPPLLERLSQRRSSDLVLGGWTPYTLRGMRRRCIERLGVDWSFQRLRQTCGTYLTNAPGIYGGASAFKSARRLGHGVQVAERFYVGRVRVPHDAATLEDAMGIADALRSRGLRDIAGECNAMS